MKTLKYFSLLLLISGLTQVFAQFPRARNHVVTDGNALNIAEINKLADQLSAQGIAPLIMFIDSKVGDSYEDIDAYLQEAIAHYDMGTANGIADDGLLIFVGTSPLRFEGGALPVYIYYGNNLVFPLERPRAGSSQSQVDYVREEVIIPELQRGNYTRAFTSALEQVGEIVGIPLRSSTLGNSTLGNSSTTTSNTNSTSSSSTSSSQNNNQASRQGGQGMPRWLLFALAGGGVFFVMGLIRNHPQEKRNRRHAGGDADKALAASAEQESQLQAVKGNLSTLLIDLAGKGDVGTGHDAYLPHDPEQQTDMVLIQSLAGVDRPELVKDLRERYGRMRDKLETVEEQFAQTSRDEPEQKNSGQAQMYLSRYTNMLDEAKIVEGFSQELAQTWENLNDEVQGVKERIRHAETGLDDLHARHRRMLAPKPNPISTFGELEQLLANAKNMVEKDRPLQSVNDLNAFDTLLEERSQSLKRYPQLVQGLDKRLDQMDGALAEGQLRIVEGREAFAVVDDFAEDSWRDIRGNGSSAEQELDHARDLVEDARFAQLEQDYLRADDNLHDAQQALGKVEANIKAIETRLKDLQHARESALALLTNTRHEYNQLEQQAKNIDAEDAVREHVLKVISQLEHAQDLADAPRPDWAAVLAEAQQADRLLDAASAALASERDRYADLQRRVQSEKEEARIALDRISNFVRVHPEVNEDEVERLFEQAEFSFVQAERLEHGESTPETMERAIQLFDEAERDAKRAYDNAEAGQRRVEKLQRDMEHQARQIERKWEEASRLVARNHSARHLKQQLESIGRNLPSSRDWAGSSSRTLVSQLESLRRLKNELDGILRQARQLNDSTGMNLPSGFPRQSRPSTRVQIPRAGSTRTGYGSTGSVLGGVLGGLINDAINDATRSSTTSGTTPRKSRRSSSYTRTPQPPRHTRSRSTISKPPSLPSRPVTIDLGSNSKASRSTKAKRLSKPRSSSGGASKGGWTPSSGGKSRGGW